jgi:hypothetical protein
VGAILIGLGPLVALIVSIASDGFVYQLVVGLHLKSIPRATYLLEMTLGALAVSRLWLLGRSMFAVDARALLERDRRPPIVFLRPFAEDSRRSSSHPVETSAMSSAWFIGTQTERSLAPAFKGLGPFVAVGRPGERLAPRGAARMYVSDEQWQPVVLDLIHRAAAVVMVYNWSDATRWEFEQVISSLDPRRLLLLVPDPVRRPIAYRQLQVLWQRRFPRPLPSVQYSIDGFIFERDWHPTEVVFELDMAVALENFVWRLGKIEPPDAEKWAEPGAVTRAQVASVHITDTAQRDSASAASDLATAWRQGSTRIGRVWMTSGHLDAWPITDLVWAYVANTKHRYVETCSVFLWDRHGQVRFISTEGPLSSVLVALSWVGQSVPFFDLVFIAASLLMRLLQCIVLLVCIVVRFRPAWVDSLPSQIQADRIVAELARTAPWLTIGYSELLKEMWNNDRAEMVARTDARRHAFAANR